MEIGIHLHYSTWRFIIRLSTQQYMIVWYGGGIWMQSANQTAHTSLYVTKSPTQQNTEANLLRRHTVLIQLFTKKL